ncbi:Protein cramped [Eumeta japonica]|uniref:Protein cramped n=1 Tax=Eumeta variegata TaxID=151549 RepID=A0A4C1XJ15_EUMVA|nr:Protein cramped [Eumeta japonica]
MRSLNTIIVVPPSATSTIPAASEERLELLGSLTTQQQQRTSARVIKKLKLDDSVTDRDKKETECESTHKLDEKVHPVKQRMPKALWSIDEKNLFFDALNEYGKDFDAITAHICAKMKKKGVSDSNLKTKHQVSHFYYRTWHKLSKHVHFDENVKKVAQELYALINYGELRKKLVSVNEKTCSRLGEMIANGSMAVRARGKNVRVRTPMCRALRTLNRMTERADYLRVCSRALVTLRARRIVDWTRVHASAHNPRAAASLPLRTELGTFIAALERRWDVRCRELSEYKTETQVDNCDMKLYERILKDTGTEENLSELNQKQKFDGTDNSKEDLDDANMELDSPIIVEQLRPRKLALHLGPSPNANIHLPTISPGETLSSQKICFSSYLERIGRRSEKDCSNKIRTPKRQRKDSTTDRDREQEQKKMKTEDTETSKPVDIDETAIDGIELMANLTEGKGFDEEKPSTEDEKEAKSEDLDFQGDNKDMEMDRDIIDKEMLYKERYACDRERDMSEKEKDSFSEMEDEAEKYNKSDTDNESDGKCEKRESQPKFKNLKVKFRIRQRKRGGSVYTLVSDIQSSNIASVNQNDECKISESEDKPQADFDLDLVMRQIRKGWSVMDAGKLTIGDLYLMFGSQSKLELDYWWAEPTPPLPQPLVQIVTHTLQKPNPVPIEGIEKNMEKDKLLFKEKSTPEKGTDSSLEDERDKARESDTDIFSPKNTFSQDSNDGLSGDERKGDQLASPEHKTHRSESCHTSFRLVNKLVNRPDESTDTLIQDRLTTMTSRLRRLLSMVDNGGSIGGRCGCGHVCSQRRKPHHEKQQTSMRLDETDHSLFRHPTPIAPKPNNNTELKPIGLNELPRLVRGRPRRDDSRVVVQRTLPLLPKVPIHSHIASSAGCSGQARTAIRRIRRLDSSMRLIAVRAPDASNLIPVKIVPNTPAAPRKILPKPTTVTTDTSKSYVYVLSQPDSQYCFEEDDKNDSGKSLFSPKTDTPEEETIDDDSEVKAIMKTSDELPVSAKEKESQSDINLQEDSKVIVQDNLANVDITLVVARIVRAGAAHQLCLGIRVHI